MIEAIPLVERHIDHLTDVIVLLHVMAAIEVPDMAAALHVTIIMVPEVVVMKGGPDPDHLDADPGVLLCEGEIMEVDIEVVLVHLGLHTTVLDLHHRKEDIRDHHTVELAELDLRFLKRELEKSRHQLRIDNDLLYH